MAGYDWNPGDYRWPPGFERFCMHFAQVNMVKSVTGQYVPRFGPGPNKTAAGCYGACSQNAIRKQAWEYSRPAHELCAALLAELERQHPDVGICEAACHRGYQDPCADREAQRKQQAAIWSEMSLPPQAQPWSEVSKGPSYDYEFDPAFMFRKYRRAFSGILSTGS